MSGELGHTLAGRGVPQPQLAGNTGLVPVTGSRGDEAAVGTDGHGIDRPRVTLQRRRSAPDPGSQRTTDASSLPEARKLPSAA